ncbi:MAG: hypothetical protein ACPGLV_19375 [Bacteroidia bacterium]
MRLFTIIILLLFALVACNKHECNFEGKVLGIDKRSCGCCGGWKIVTAKGDTSMYFDFTDGSVLSSHKKDSVPFYIRFNYRESDGPCKKWVKEIFCVEIID